jgi:putative ABC transport system substrate-binding protein
MFFALCASAEAQQPKKIPRIGYLSGAGDPSNPGPNVEAFRRGLQELGYIEGKNILVEYRYIEGKRDRVPSLVAELVRCAAAGSGWLSHTVLVFLPWKTDGRPILWDAVLA